MIFSNFCKTEESGKITFINEIPIEYVDVIKFYKDDSSGVFIKKEFRWSFNNDYWSSWELLNQGNLTNISINNNQYLFIEIRYVGDGNVSSFTISYDQVLESERPQPNYSVESSSNYTSNLVSYSDIQNYNICCNDNKNLINSNLLENNTASYYLWRPNHQGQQSISTITGLQKILNDLSYSINNATVKGASNVNVEGIGTYYGVEDKTLYFKKITSGNKINLSETDSGKITISVDDGSINFLYNKIGLKLNEASLGPQFYWTDGSLFVYDSSNTYFGSSNINIDASKNISLDASLESINYIQFNTTWEDGHSEGRIHWDKDDKTLEIDTEVTGTHIQIGQEIVVRCTNKTDSTIINGSCVYVNGAQGNRPTIALADNNSYNTAATTLGLATHDIAKNRTGYITSQGIVREIDTSTWPEGTIVWLDSSGCLTGIRPTPPKYNYAIGQVLNQHAVEGMIYVKPELVPRMSWLSDVSARGSQLNKDILWWDASSYVWSPVDLSTLKTELVPNNITRKRGDVSVNLVEINIDWENLNEFISINDISIFTDVSIIFNNTLNAETGKFLININNLSTLYFVEATKMKWSDTRWNNVTKKFTPLDNGIYKIDISKINNIFYLDIYGPYI